MNCPYCNSRKIEVMDSRPSENNSVRRRRICKECNKRFTTYEMTLNEIEKNNNFIRDTIKDNFIKSAEKIFERPITSIERHSKKK